MIEFTNENGANILAYDQVEANERILLETAGAELSPVISPDGKWMSYTSDEAGRGEVYISPFPEQGGKWQISTDGGAYPKWSPDGRKVFFRRQGFLMEVDIDTRGGSIQASRPRQVLDGFPSLSSDIDYDVLAWVSNRIINEVPGVNRVAYDISSKPPSTIEWQ